MLRELDSRKKKILKTILKSREISVAEIQRKTSIPRSSLVHHLGILARKEIVLQEKRGKELTNKINPLYIQNLRAIFRIKAPKMLISGYTYNPDTKDIKTLQVLQRALEFLKKENIEIKRTISFTIPEAKERIRETDFVKGDVEITLDFKDYQNFPEKIEKEMEKVIIKNLSGYEIIVDLTPLTKLYSIIGLSLARKYGLKAFYHAGERIIWF